VIAGERADEPARELVPDGSLESVAGNRLQVSEPGHAREVIE
jgi:hypothetical protein